MTCGSFSALHSETGSIVEHHQNPGMGQEVKQLSNIASTQPHATYAATTHGLTNKWSYLQRTVLNIGGLFQPLENAIRHHLLPALTGRKGITDSKTDLTQPNRLGGLGIPNPTRVSSIQHRSSQNISAPLTALILQQDMSYCSLCVK